MSKSSTATAPKIPPQLPSQSAWARGPPPHISTASSSRSQSPAPANVTSPNGASSNSHPTHSRRPSTLGQGVSIKDGINIPRNSAGTAKSASPVTFGSIDDAPVPISSSPASAPAVKAETVKSFGSVAVQNGTSTAASKSAFTSRPTSLAQSPSNPSSDPSPTTTSAPPPPSTPSAVTKIDRKSIAKLFQGPSLSSKPPSESAPSPSTRPMSLPPQSHQGSSQGQPYSPPTFTPRSQAQNGNSNGAPPRSPVYPRAMTNGTSGGVNMSGRPSAGPGGPGPMPTGMPSPRLTPHQHQHQGPPTGLPPAAPMWSQTYYYPPYGMPAEQYMTYSPGWAQHPLPPQHQGPPHHPPPGPPGPPNSAMPMSPRNPPPPLQAPGTPTPSHALPLPVHPSQHAPPSHPPPRNITSPPPTPSTAGGGGPGPRLNTNASAFVPGKKISIKDSQGQEVNLESLKRSQPGAGPAGPGMGMGLAGPQPPASPIGFKQDRKRTTSVRIESPQDKQQRLAREQRIADEQAKALAEKEKAAREKEEKERAEVESREREKREKEERARKEKEQLELEREREAQRKREEEEARVRKEKEAEEERVRKEKEADEARVRALEEEKKRAEEEERVREVEEAARLEKEVADKEAAAAATAAAAAAVAVAAAEKEQKAKAAATVAAAAAVAAEEAGREDGEIDDKSAPITDKAVVGSPQPAHATLSFASQRAAEKEALRIDTSAHHHAPEPKRRPDPLNLITGVAVPAPLPSALATARIIEDIGTIQYPEGVRSPKVELNVNAQKGKFRYDRDFLLQFMSICKEKPDNLPPLDAIGLEPSDQSTYNMARGGSGRRAPSGMVTPGGASRQGSVGLGFLPSSIGKSGPGSSFAMGQFSTSKLTSEERFAMASGRSVSTSGAGGILPMGGRPSALVRTSSQGGPGTGKERERIRSRRGEKRPETSRSSVGGHPSSSGQSNSSMMMMGPPLDPVAPLEASANRWVAGSTRRVQAADSDSPEVVDRKVKGLLNKLTMERFDSISDQIIAWANKSEKEKDGRTLIQVIRLVFEKATDEATFSEMYARLCRKMMEQISAKVQDDGIKNAEGKPIAGGQLFRKYLLNRCQEDFERGWVAKEVAAAAAASKATEDEAVKAAQDKDKEDAGEGELYSDEYYTAQKAKRRGLGLIRFIGELFKLQMLTERIMHECIKKLLGNVENPEEEEIESLCKLLSTVGQMLDTQKAHAHMDVYFSRMKELCKSPNVNSRMQFMLQDVLELRERKWIPRVKSAAPATIAQIHEAAAKEKAAQDKETQQRMNMSRTGSRRGGERGDFHVGPDGWTVAGTAGPPRQPPKAGDLSNFGKISKTMPMSFAPGGVFAGKKDKPREVPLSRTASSQNMFSMLSQSSEIAADPAAPKSSRPPSRKASVDFGQAAPAETPLQRKRLNLLPRSVPMERSESAPAASEASSDDEQAEVAGAPAMSEADAKKKIDEDLKEFFTIRSIEEAESYFSNLPSEHRFRLVDKLVLSAVERKQEDAELVAALFVHARKRDLCSPASFEEGFTELASLLDDLVYDAPKAFELTATMMKGAGLDADEERRARLVGKSADSERLVALLT